MAAVFSFIDFLNASMDPKSFSNAALNAPEGLLEGPAGPRFFQKREWLIWPEAGRLSNNAKNRAVGRRTSSVEFQCSLEVNPLLQVMRRCVLLFRRIEPVDIGLMVLRVVELHNFLRDVGFECLSHRY